MVAPKNGNGTSGSPRDQGDDGSPSASPSIHFGGTWPDEGREVVRRAIEEVEARHPPDDDRPRFGATWICTLVDDPPRFFLFASRHGVDRIFRARGFEQLADEIRNYFRFR